MSRSYCMSFSHAAFFGDIDDTITDELLQDLAMLKRFDILSKQDFREWYLQKNKKGREMLRELMEANDARMKEFSRIEAEMKNVFEYVRAQGHAIGVALKIPEDCDLLWAIQNILLLTNRRKRKEKLECCYACDLRCDYSAEIFYNNVHPIIEKISIEYFRPIEESIKVVTMLNDDVDRLIGAAYDFESKLRRFDDIDDDDGGSERDESGDDVEDERNEDDLMTAKCLMDAECLQCAIDFDRVAMIQPLRDAGCSEQ